MRKVIVFNHVTLDGYFVDIEGEMGWAHDTKPDPEYNAFVAENAGSGGELLFGRKTYELMAGYWPTPMAHDNDLVAAEGLNNLSKVVFSRTMGQPTWKNTRLVKSDMSAEIRQVKREPGPDMVILGSGSTVAQLAAEGLIDEYQFVLNPIVLGKGRTMFEGIPCKLMLKRTKTRTFRNDKILLCYEPAS